MICWIFKKTIWHFFVDLNLLFIRGESDSVINLPDRKPEWVWRIVISKKNVKLKDVYWAEQKINRAFLGLKTLQFCFCFAMFSFSIDVKLWNQIKFCFTWQSNEIRFETICLNSCVFRLEKRSAGILEPTFEKRVPRKPLRSTKDFSPKVNVDCRSKSPLKVKKLL